MGYAEYFHTLGPEDNIVSEWAPFSTHTEWELAQWVKLCGLSSTVLLELLKIDGVSQLMTLDPTYW